MANIGQWILNPIYGIVELVIWTKQLQYAKKASSDVFCFRYALQQTIEVFDEVEEAVKVAKLLQNLQHRGHHKCLYLD